MVEEYSLQNELEVVGKMFRDSHISLSSVEDVDARRLLAGKLANKRNMIYQHYSRLGFDREQISDYLK